MIFTIQGILFFIYNLIFAYILIKHQALAILPRGNNFFYTNTDGDGYCLLYNDVRGGIFFRTPAAHQITLYCLRPSKENNSIVFPDFNNSNDPSFTFVALKERHVTSQMLLSWSASIELAEEYQMFLNSDSYSSPKKDFLFHNCTKPWFGPLCRFRYRWSDDSIQEAIDGLILDKLLEHGPDSIIVTATCYIHLNCSGKWPCLSWREICDKKVDCSDSVDEIDCWKLEANECNESEFRCQNGQCIPVQFFFDKSHQPDCLDESDEYPLHFRQHDCFDDLSFQCEEHLCQWGQYDFSCGDGECTDGIKECSNGRSHLLPADFCSNTVEMDFFNNINGAIDTEWLTTFCSKLSKMEGNRSMLYEFRYVASIFGHVRLLYSSEKVQSNKPFLPDYVCYDEKLCVDFLPATAYFNNLACRHFQTLGLKHPNSYNDIKTLIKDIKILFRGCLVTGNEMKYCNFSWMYQCENSTKCISLQRLVDGIQDCPFNDDETFNESCSLKDIRQRFNCSLNGNKICYALTVVLDNKIDCDNGEDELQEHKILRKKHIYFRTICDGITELQPVLIDGRYETDETDCSHWLCNNTNNRCDTRWMCEDGADEVNCPSSTCPKDHHRCVFLNNTSNVSCLPISLAGNGIQDCLGGTEELIGYLRNSSPEEVYYTFQCWNDTKRIKSRSICDGRMDCIFHDDETFCENIRPNGFEQCSESEPPMTEIEKFLGSCHIKMWPTENVHFELFNSITYPPLLKMHKSRMLPSTLKNTPFSKSDLSISTESDSEWPCNRGIDLYVRMPDFTAQLYCLCPPSFYGDRCQYENQRVSVSLQIRVKAHWYDLLIFLITLIDNERNIEAHDYVEYLPIRDCRSKFYTYLLYTTRPKSVLKNYSVQIDAFVQMTMVYRASWIFPLQFPFLPVHRVAVLLEIPISNAQPTHRCWPPCKHGQCYFYINKQNSTFCLCEHGWSGIQCNVKEACDCANGSLCISKSICLCSNDRFGPQCNLLRLPCQAKSCLNGGKCLSLDVRYIPGYLQQAICVCPKGFIGEYCQLQQAPIRIDLTFHRKISIPPSVIIHFIDVQLKTEPNRTSVIKNIGFNQDSLTLYISIWFNIAIAQIFDRYHLIILQEETILSANISTEVMPSNQCQSIQELLNRTLASQHLLKRIKYYHIPCQQNHQLICFFDDVYICFCTLDRQSNCLEFDHNEIYNCGGENFCENEGYCFQEDPKCPTPPICTCRQCNFGSRCQFSTKGFTLSLDTILGYHIYPRTGINHQSFIVKVAIGIATFMFIFGLINGFLSFQTFRGKEVRTVGCGHYLFVSSIISIVTVIISTAKFSVLLAFQIGSINNRSFMHIQCVCIEFFLRSLLSTNDWVNACVAIERIVVVRKGTKFNKTKSKQVANWMVWIVLFLTSSMYAYDPIYRGLIDDDQDQRTWCVTQYSSSLQMLDWILNIFHFFIPFTINGISAMIIILTVARTRSKSQRKTSFESHFYKQLKHHKHLLISPLLLILLALPRLIISFLSGCMKTARDSWFYLIGYYISLVPPMTTFAIFVLPSDTYKKEFRESMKRFY